ncbi:MAG TPA: ShlB/FhaC/HecB family hemolysin secretion/activation protein [Bryobacteraceae bacterium]|nr:ShlB/FhaC/HecB family hemolysin secretion/activation protein [Bryobacteraceae bacterium]
MVKVRFARLLAITLAAAAMLPCLAQESEAQEKGTKNAASSQTGSAVVVPALKGLVFVANTGDIRPEGVNATGVVINGVAMLDHSSFRERLTPYLGKPLTFDDLHEITRAVVLYYNAHHHPLVDALAPEQDVQNGVVQIVVAEFRVGSVRTKGNRWFSNGILTSPMNFHHGDTIDTSKVLSDLDAVNANPFRRVNLVYQPASEPGYTDLVLETQDRLPLRFFTGFDNSGTAATGHTRLDAGVTWGNAFGLDQQLTYQFSSSNDLYLGSSRSPGAPGGPLFAGHSLNWVMPLPFGDSVSIFGDYERTVPDIGADFGLVGLNGQASIRYMHMLPRTASFVESLQAGYDFKITNNNLDFSGVAVSSNSLEIDQFPVSYLANLTDPWGVNSSSTAAVYGPGSLTAGNKPVEFQAAGPSYGFPSPRYLYVREDFSRLTRLPFGAVWSVRALAQISNANLLYTEQLVAGGPDLLRGYQTNSILGDQGAIVSNELRMPPLRKAFDQQIGQLQFLGFWDYGSLHAHKTIEGYVNDVNASSMGVGMRYNFRTNVTAKIDYGWQLEPLPGFPRRGHMANIGLVLGN